ncbi:hypothetical protein NPIL_112261 [Nephila pilipes]|uniref:Uncharacterized protein n=1 Tax=Nephila pilipes TaxID=299642 RepID=A0A8X6IHX3_NEPPI|nr:hypothetical protein NPIL_112261 [Nephila pilipes]
MIAFLRGYWISFIEIFGFVTIVELLKHYILPIFARETRIQGRIIPEEISETIYETFKPLNVELVIPAITEGKQRKQEPKLKKSAPIVYSITIHKICEALGLDSELNPGAKFESFKQQKKVVPVVQSKAIFKFCEALDIKCTLGASPNNLK